MLATVFFLPLRVRALFLVLCPRTGSPLSAYGESDTVTDAAIATDIHESLDVHLDGRTELAFNLVLTVDEITDCRYLLVVPVSDLDAAIDTAGVQNLLG